MGPIRAWGKHTAAGKATHVCLVGKIGHPSCAYQCPLMTQDGHRTPTIDRRRDQEGTIENGGAREFYSD
jgi:hypothetical protein